MDANTQAASKRAGGAKVPQCSIHGEMVRVEAHTPEQKFCGEWFRCPRCASSVLRPSPELTAQVSR